MGDASLYRNRFRDGTYQGNYLLDIAHCQRQLEYLEHKRKIANQIFDYEIPVRSKTIQNKKTGKTYFAYKFATRVHSRLTFIARKIYINGTKKITPWVLNNITEEGLAYWWMDDGSLTTRNAKRAKGAITWGTYGFGKDEVDMFNAWLSKHYDTTLSVKKHSKSGWFLYGKVQENMKLVNAMAKYSIPCMEYKFPVMDSTAPASCITG